MTQMDLSSQNRTYHIAQDYMQLLPNYYKWVYGAFRPWLRGTVIELGCGAGIGIGCYLDRVQNVIAVDHDPALIERIGRLYPGGRVEASCKDLLGDWNGLHEGSADAVVMLDALEHFADDAALVKRSARLLKPGGHLLIKVPAHKTMYSAMDVASGHYRRYDREDLVRLAQTASLTVRRLSQINPVGAALYRRKREAKTNFSRTFSPRQLRLINLGIPMLALVDGAVSKLGLPGLSLMATLEYPARPD